MERKGRVRGLKAPFPAAISPLTSAGRSIEWLYGAWKYGNNQAGARRTRAPVCFLRGLQR
jgi:hypothetical protein